MYMYKQYLLLNNVQWLKCHKTPTNKPIQNLIYIPKRSMLSIKFFYNSVGGIKSKLLENLNQILTLRQRFDRFICLL